MHRTLVAAMLLSLAVALPAKAQDAPQAVLYKTPECGCCDGHADYLRAHGYSVAVEESHDLMLIKQAHGVPEALAGCHTILIDGYVVEGHVPIASIERLRAERPDIAGISLPGMPQGSPGMSGVKDEPWTIWAFGEDGLEVFAVE